jgi:hypothetical protein
MVIGILSGIDLILFYKTDGTVIITKFHVIMFINLSSSNVKSLCLMKPRAMTYGVDV